VALVLQVPELFLHLGEAALVGNGLFVSDEIGLFMAHKGLPVHNVGFLVVLGVSDFYADIGDWPPPDLVDPKPHGMSRERRIGMRASTSNLPFRLNGNVAIGVADQGWKDVFSAQGRLS